MHRVLLRVTFALAIMAISSSGVYAQPLIMLLVGDKISSEDFVGGITGGINLTNVSELEGASARLSWSFGASLHWRLSEQWHFAPEVFFKAPGGTNGLQGLFQSQPSIDTMINDRKEWLSTSYVAIPLLVKYRVGMFYIMAGPQIGYLVAATDNASGTSDEGAAIVVEKSAFGRLNRWDVGAVIGAEILLVPEFGINSLRLGVRYYQGLIDVVTNDNLSSYNSGVSVSVGVPIGGKK